MSSKDDPKDPRVGGDLPKVDLRPTRRLEPGMLKPSWPIVLAELEQLGAESSTESVLAMRLGLLALVQECVRDLAQRKAPRSRLVDLKRLVEALAQMPFES